MNATVLSVTFETDEQEHKDGQFSVPQKVCDILNLKNGDSVDLEIKGHHIKTKLSSGNEVYGQEIVNLVKAKERIRVLISRA